MLLAPRFNMAVEAKMAAVFRGDFAQINNFAFLNYLYGRCIKCIDITHRDGCYVFVVAIGVKTYFAVSNQDRAY